MPAALPRCTAKLNFWINLNAWQWPPVGSFNLRPIPRTSMLFFSVAVSACCFNCHCFKLIKATQGSIFISIECLSGIYSWDSCTALSFTCIGAKLQYQQRGVPCLYTNIVMSSGFLTSCFLPSSLERPGDSSRHVTPDVWRAHSTTSFKSTCLLSLPALSLHTRLWRPSVLTLAPHLQTSGSHTGAPILRALVFRHLKIRSLNEFFSYKCCFFSNRCTVKQIRVTCRILDCVFSSGEISVWHLG